MILEELLPCRVYLNLARRQDRRFAVQGELERAGIRGVRRFPAVDGKRLGGARGFGSAGYHALAITNRMVLREAGLRKAGAVLMLEDDVVLHPRFRELVAQIELPEDWEMFFFGCKHVGPPEPAGPGLVRVTRAWGWHAVAFRDRAYHKVRRALAPLRGGRPSGSGSYRGRCRPMPRGRIWRCSENASDLVKGIDGAYRPDGEQAVKREAIQRLSARMAALYGPGGGLGFPDRAAGRVAHDHGCDAGER